MSAACLKVLAASGVRVRHFWARDSRVVFSLFALHGSNSLNDDVPPPGVAPRPGGLPGENIFAVRPTLQEMVLAVVGQYTDVYVYSAGFPSRNV